MPHITDIPEDFEIWVGCPTGLRLRKHPELDKALEYLEEYPMVIRRTTVIESSRLNPTDKPKLSLTSMPVFRRSSVGDAIELSLEIDCPHIESRGPVQFARIFIESDDTLLEESAIIRPGRRQFVNLPFPAFETETELRVSVELRDRGEAGRIQSTFSLLPEKRLTFYYAFQTHLDLGWTDRVAPTIESLKKMTREVAIKVCRQFMDRAEGEKFIWTCECSDALRLAWDGADEAQRKDLREFIRMGLIQSCSLPFSLHTGLMSKDLLRRSIDRSFDLRREIGVEKLDLSVAQSNDVPGHSWIMPDVLAERGIQRVMIGHNGMVRACKLPPLFWWQGPSGKKILALATSCVDYGATSPVPESPRELYGLSANNPDALRMPGTAIMRSIAYGENCGPEGAEREINAIAAWNEEFAWPKLVIGAPKDYFNHIAPEINPDELPVVDKEISDWWLDGPASMPRAMAQFRKVMNELPRLAEIIPQDHADRDCLAEIEENLIRHAEHTFGMNAQLVRPTSSAQNWALDGMDDYAGSWQDKEGYAARAMELLSELKRKHVTTEEAPLADPTDWTIEWDETGITRLADDSGKCWYDRSMLDDAPPFACLTQQLLGKDLDEWFHHNPAEAPNAGDYDFVLASISAYEDEQSKGVAMRGTLDSPAGAIESVVIKVGNAVHSSDLIVDVQLKNKQATAQAECLTLALPFLSQSPLFKTDVGEVLLTVDEDQLPDANRDEHAVVTGWILEDPPAPAGLAVSSAEAFLWHFGGRRYCQWNKGDPKRSATAYAHLLNNVWNTNFRCWIGGDLNYTIRLRTCGENPLAALRNMSELW